MHPACWCSNCQMSYVCSQTIFHYWYPVSARQFVFSTENKLCNDGSRGRISCKNWASCVWFLMFNFVISINKGCRVNATSGVARRHVTFDTLRPSSARERVECKSGWNAIERIKRALDHLNIAGLTMESYKSDAANTSSTLISRILRCLGKLTAAVLSLSAGNGILHFLPLGVSLSKQ